MARLTGVRVLRFWRIRPASRYALTRFRHQAYADLRPFTIYGSQQVPLGLFLRGQLRREIFEMLCSLAQPFSGAFRERQYFLQQVFHISPCRIPLPESFGRRFSAVLLRVFPRLSALDNEPASRDPVTRSYVGRQSCLQPIPVLLA